MKVGELIEELRELNPNEEIKFRVHGYVCMKQELTGRYSGEYDLEMNVDTEAELDCIENDGEIAIWI